MGGGPQQPASGRAIRGGGAPDHRRPSQLWKAAPRERPSPTPTASKAGPQERTLWDRCWVPRPHRPHPGHTGRGTPAARPRGRVAGGGTAPDTRRPSHRWRAGPPGDSPPRPPRHAAPTGHTGQGDSDGPPHAHACARSTRVTDPNNPPSGRAAGGEERLTSDAHHDGGRHPPRGRPPATPTASNAGPQGARCGAGARSPRPHQPHPGHTGRRTPATRPRGRTAGRGTARDTRRPSQRWQATPPPGTSPHHPHGTQPPQGMQAKGTVLARHIHTPAPAARGWRTRTARRVGGQFGGGGAPDLRRPSQRRKAPPPGTPSRHPHSEQRRPTRAHAVGLVLGPHARTDSTRDTRVSEPPLPAPEDGRPGEGQRLTPDAPDNGGRPPPPVTAPHHPHGTQPPQGMQAKGTVMGPHIHTPAPAARGWRTRTARSVGGQSGEGERLTSDAPHNGGRHPPRGGPPTTPTASNAGRQGRTLWGRCWVPTPAPTAAGTHGSRNSGRPPEKTGSRGRDSA